MNEIVATDFNRWYECRTPNENAVGMIHKGDKVSIVRKLYKGDKFEYLQCY
jgi:hypothetical protein